MIGGMSDDESDMAGVLLGGYRLRTHRRPSAWNKKVSAYVRRHGGTVAEAAHALRGSGEGSYGGYRRRRRAPVRRRRRVAAGDSYGGYRRRRAPVRRRRRAYGGAGRKLGTLESLFFTPSEKAQYAKAEKAALRKALCSGKSYERRLSHAKTMADLKRIQRECQLDPEYMFRQNLKKGLRDIARGKEAEPTAASIYGTLLKGRSGEV
jgi:hypothetical protein